MVLERLGMPSSAIHVLPGRNAETAVEVRTVAKGLHELGGDRVILVTSSYHSRRVEVRLFHASSLRVGRTHYDKPIYSL